MTSRCALCRHAPSADVVEVFGAERWRVVRVVDEPAFPAFYRLIWREHAAEFSSLTQAERAECIEAVVVIERVLIDVLAPTKVNLASLGNVVPHLHWHVVARFDDDSHFPRPIWASAIRPGGFPIQLSGVDLATVDRAMTTALSNAFAAAQAQAPRNNTCQPSSELPCVLPPLSPPSSPHP